MLATALKPVDLKGRTYQAPYTTEPVSQALSKPKAKQMGLEAGLSSHVCLAAAFVNEPHSRQIAKLLTHEIGHSIRYRAIHA
jgi:uncharacterized protein YjaZ